MELVSEFRWFTPNRLISGKSEASASFSEFMAWGSFHQNALLMLLETKNTGENGRCRSRLPSPVSYFLNNNNCCHYYYYRLVTFFPPRRDKGPEGEAAVPLRQRLQQHARPGRPSRPKTQSISGQRLLRTQSLHLLKPTHPSCSRQSQSIGHHCLLDLAEICVLNKTKPKKYSVSQVDTVR